MDEINALIEKAEEDINAVELLLSQKYYRIAISRIYYAMFYITEGILLSRNLSYSSHHAVISFFNKEFVKTGILSKRFGKGLQEVFNLRENGDYEPVIEITKEQVENYLNLAKEFLKVVKEYLEKNRK